MTTVLDKVPDQHVYQMPSKWKSSNSPWYRWQALAKNGRTSYNGVQNTMQPHTSTAVADCIYQLLEWCDDLRKDIARTFGDLTQKTELQIKTLAVCQENTMITSIGL